MPRAEVSSRLTVPHQQERRKYRDGSDLGTSVVRRLTCGGEGSRFPPTLNF
jgi:hypothetical protein